MVYFKNLQTIGNIMETKIYYLERKISERVLQLQKKLLLISTDLNTVKRENRLKCESSARLANSLQSLRLETENNAKTIEELKAELETVNKLRHKAEKNAYDLKIELQRKETDLESLQKELVC